MQRGFRDLDGVPVPFESIDPVRDCRQFNTSPATLAMLIDSARSREGIGFSASQLSTTPRQHLLRSMDYYPTTGSAISGHMGTMRHQQINVPRDQLIVEQRFWSKLMDISGQIDHAAIVELTDDGTLVVDLYDLKTIKWYSVTLCAKDIWKNHPDYAWQLNLCATMLEESSDGLGGLGHLCSCATGTDCNISRAAMRVRVRNLYLECIPADSSYKNADEADRLGFPEWQKVIIPIERRSADETYATYEAALKLRDDAIAAGYAPLCKDRWSNKNVDNLRCRSYCDVREECIAFSHTRGEAHPIAPLELALTASIAQAQEVAHAN